jgi:hypothetical protein
MKQNEFKKMIKEAVREVFQEEIKNILLEAVRSSKTVINENANPIPYTTKPNEITSTTPDIKRNLRAMIGGEFDTIVSVNSSHAQPLYTPPPVNTTGDGSSLPPGEVSLNQIMGIMSNK